MKVKIALIVFTIIMVVMLSLATVKEEQSRQSPQISSAVFGEIKDENSQPLEGVTITSGDRTATTDKRGNYLLSLGNSTKEEVVDIFIDKKGFKAQTHYLPGGEIKNLSVVMIKE